MNNLNETNQNEAFPTQLEPSRKKGNKTYGNML